MRFIVPFVDGIAMFSLVILKPKRIIWDQPILAIAPIINQNDYDRYIVP